MTSSVGIKVDVHILHEVKVKVPDFECPGPFGNGIFTSFGDFLVC